MRRIIFHNSVSEQPVYKFVLQQKIAEVCKAIGFDDSDITWIIFDNRNFNLIKHTANYGWNLGELFTVNHGEDYGYCYPARNEIWISTFTLQQAAPAARKVYISSTPSICKRDILADVLIDEITHIQTQCDHNTYYQAKIELTYDDIVTVLNKIKGSNGITIFRPEDYLYDLVNSICVLYREGVTYKFTHRSFQEYFSAIFLKELSDQNMEKMGISLVKKDYFRASHDSVFFMLRDMAEQRFEQNILLPFVVEFETTCSDTDKYDFYFEELSPEIFFDEVDFDGEIHLVICADFNVEAVGFIYAMARHYRDTTSSHVKQLKDAEDELRNFLISERDYKIEEKVDLTEYRDDSKLYSLLKATWIGDYLTVMANLREMLEHRRRKEEQDLFELLDE